MMANAFVARSPVKDKSLPEYVRASSISSYLRVRIAAEPLGRRQQPSGPRVYQDTWYVQLAPPFFRHGALLSCTTRAAGSKRRANA